MVAPALPLRIVEYLPAAVMDVRALAVDEFAQHPEFAEIERQKLLFAVAAVLKLHAVDAAFLRRLHELVALFKIHRGGHFDENVLAGLHRLDGDGDVGVPRRAVVDGVHIFATAKPAVFDVGTAVHMRLSSGLPEDDPGRLVRVFAADVADGGYFHARNLHKAVDGPGSTRADADDADADAVLHRRRAEIPHRGRVRPGAGPFSACATGDHAGSGRHRHALEKLASVRLH